MDTSFQAGPGKAETSLLIGGPLDLGGEWLGFQHMENQRPGLAATRAQHPPPPSAGRPDGPAARGDSRRARLTPTHVLAADACAGPPWGGGGAAHLNMGGARPCADGDSARVLGVTARAALYPTSTPWLN